MIETDCEVDFAPPLDYVEPNRAEAPAAESLPEATPNGELLQMLAASVLGILNPLYLCELHPITGKSCMAGSNAHVSCRRCKVEMLERAPPAMG